MFKNYSAAKKDKYYLELKETDTAKTDASVAATAVTIVGTAPPKAETVEPSAEIVVSEEPPSGEATEASLAPDNKKSKKASKEKAKGKGKEKAVAPAPAPAPKILDAAELALRAINNDSSNGKSESEAVIFAANSAIGSTMSRRRPGPSLNMFKDMARKAKIPTTKR